VPVTAIPDVLAWAIHTTLDFIYAESLLFEFATQSFAEDF